MPFLQTATYICALQALQEAAATKGHQLTVLTPALLRKQLKLAGDVLQASEVNNVLEFAIKDSQYRDLDGMYLVHLYDDTIQKLEWLSGSSPRGAKQYFMYAKDKQSQDTYDLVSAVDAAKTAVDCEAWRTIARYGDNHSRGRQFIKLIAAAMQQPMGAPASVAFVAALACKPVTVTRGCCCW